MINIDSIKIGPIFKIGPIYLTNKASPKPSPSKYRLPFLLGKGLGDRSPLRLPDPHPGPAHMRLHRWNQPRCAGAHRLAGKKFVVQ